MLMNEFVGSMIVHPSFFWMSQQWLRVVDNGSWRLMVINEKFLGLFTRDFWGLKEIVI